MVAGKSFIDVQDTIFIGFLMNLDKLDSRFDGLKENGSFDVGLNVRDGDSPGAVGVFLPGGTSIRQTLTGESDTGNLLALDRRYGEDEILAGSNGAAGRISRTESSPPLSQVTLTV